MDKDHRQVTEKEIQFAFPYKKISNVFYKQNKTIMSYNFSPIKLIKIKMLNNLVWVWGNRHSYVTGSSAIWHNCFSKQFGRPNYKCTYLDSIPFLKIHSQTYLHSALRNTDKGNHCSTV